MIQLLTKSIYEHTFGCVSVCVCVSVCANVCVRVYACVYVCDLVGMNNFIGSLELLIKNTD